MIKYSSRPIFTLLLSMLSINAFTLIVDRNAPANVYKDFYACFPNGTLIESSWLITSARQKTPLSIFLGDKSYKVRYTVVHPNWIDLDSKPGIYDKDPNKNDAYCDVKLVRLEKPFTTYPSFVRARFVPQDTWTKIISFERLKGLPPDQNQPGPRKYGEYLQVLATAKTGVPVADLPLRFQYVKDINKAKQDVLRSNGYMDISNGPDVGAPVFIDGATPDQPLLAGQLFAVDNTPNQFTALNYSSQINDWIDNVTLLDGLGGLEAVQNAYPRAVEEMANPIKVAKVKPAPPGRFRETQHLQQLTDVFRLFDFSNCSYAENLFGLSDYPWYQGFTFKDANKESSAIATLTKTLIGDKQHNLGFWSAQTNLSLKNPKKILFVPSDNAMSLLTPQALGFILDQNNLECRRQFIADHLYDNVNFAEFPQFSPSLNTTDLSSVESFYEVVGAKKVIHQVQLQPNAVENTWKLQFNKSLKKAGFAQIVKSKRSIGDKLDIYQIDRPIISPELEKLLRSKNAAQIFKDETSFKQDLVGHTVWAQVLRNGFFFADLCEATGLDRYLRSADADSITLILPTDDALKELLSILQYEDWNEMSLDDLTLMLKHFIIPEKVVATPKNAVIEPVTTTKTGITRNLMTFANLIISYPGKGKKPAGEPNAISPDTVYSDLGKTVDTLANTRMFFKANDQAYWRLKHESPVEEIYVTISGFSLNFLSDKGIRSYKTNVQCQDQFNCSNGIIYYLNNAENLIGSNPILVARFTNPKAVK